MRVSQVSNVTVIGAGFLSRKEYRQVHAPRNVSVLGVRPVLIISLHISSCDSLARVLQHRCLFISIFSSYRYVLDVHLITFIPGRVCILVFHPQSLTVSVSARCGSTVNSYPPTCLTHEL